MRQTHHAPQGVGLLLHLEQVVKAKRGISWFRRAQSPTSKLLVLA